MLYRKHIQVVLAHVLELALLATLRMSCTQPCTRSSFEHFRVSICLSTVSSLQLRSPRTKPQSLNLMHFELWCCRIFAISGILRSACHVLRGPCARLARLFLDSVLRMSCTNMFGRFFIYHIVILTWLQLRPSS
jgi:hypothetical protein